VTRRNTQRETAARRRRDLIEATIWSIAEHGIAGTSIESITRAAGVSRGLPRYYFGAKSALFAAAFDRLANDFLEALVTGSKTREQDALSRLDGAIEALYREPHYQPKRLRAWFGFWHAAPSDPLLNEINEKVGLDHVAFVTDLIDEAARECGASIDAERAGKGLTALMDGTFLELASDSGILTPKDAEIICKDYARMVLTASPPHKNSVSSLR
jgi:TetR/AcrR family transcriptional repressor of bet genes